MSSTHRSPCSTPGHARAGYVRCQEPPGWFAILFSALIMHIMSASNSPDRTFCTQSGIGRPPLPASARDKVGYCNGSARVVTPALDGRTAASDAAHDANSCSRSADGEPGSAVNIIMTLPGSAVMASSS